MDCSRFVVLLAAVLSSWASAFAGEPVQNLLKNPGFEEPLDPVWEKRTPDDADRKLYHDAAAGRSGAAAVLENAQPAFTRLRQGHDRSIAIAPGSLVELAAWIKSELSDEGEAQLQIYCMDEQGGILAQPVSRSMPGRFDWIRTQVRTAIPEHTAYVMAYLQIRGGVGRVLFDDVELVVRRPPVPKQPAPKIGLLTDLGEDHPCVKELKILFEEGLQPVAGDDARDLQTCVGAIVLWKADTPESVLQTVADFARGGGRVFMDIRNFAQSQKTTAVAVAVQTPIPAAEPAAAEPAAAATAPAATALQKPMAAGLRMVQAAEATAGFQTGQVMPRASWPDGKLFVLPAGFSRPGLEVLAVAPGGEPGLVRLPVGKGSVTACDVLSLREPFYRHVDAYYKYAPLSGALTNPVRFGQYYPRKFTYAQFVDQMKRLAAEFPAIRFQEEGPASEDYRLYSLNLGRPGAPLYFLYAAAHGSEWEPGYGLLTFARRLAEGRLQDIIDLEAIEVKIVPFLNPWGYDHMRRQNARGVDLNRQGDWAWDAFQGTDSNQDGPWSPGDYDWKGSRPFSEPEAQTYQRIAELPNLHCVLDFHGNTSATNNKLGVLPVTAQPENDFLAMDLQRLANERLRGRHLMRQNDEETVSQYLLDRVYVGGHRPMLMNTSMRGKFGLLIELTAGYGSTYGTIVQTDVVCELCRALFITYPPPKPRPQ